MIGHFLINQLLGCIPHDRYVRCTELERSTGISSRMLVRAIKEMEERGFVEVAWRKEGKRPGPPARWVKLTTDNPNRVEEAPDVDRSRPVSGRQKIKNRVEELLRE